MFERVARTCPKPAFNLPAAERVVWERPFCRAIAFGEPSTKPKLLLVAPPSRHCATLLRGTAVAFLDTHQMFITDWADDKMVPLAAGRFDLDDYIDCCIAMFETLGPDLHVAAVCQSSVPAVAAVACMEAEENPLVPRFAIPRNPERHGTLESRVLRPLISPADWARRGGRDVSRPPHGRPTCGTATASWRSPSVP